MRNRLIALGITALAAVALWAALPTSSARCTACIPTFCGHSAECPGACACAIPMGEATGTCVEIR